MDRWKPLQIRCLLICLVLNMFDGADVLVVSFVAPVLTSEWAVSDATFGLVFSSGLAGMTLGALVIAPFADLWGRKTLILVALALLTSGMLASALAENVPQLVALRFWTGLGIGAMLASVAALASEYAPEKYRSFAVTTATAGYPAGAVVAGLASNWILPAYGWQGLFVVIGLGSLAMAPVVLLALPESVQFLLARQPRTALARANALLAQLSEAALTSLPAPGAATRHSPVRHLLERDRVAATLCTWGAFFASFFTLYYLTSWIPRIAVQAGFGLATGIAGATVFNLGSFVGLIALGWLASRVDLAKLIGAAFILAAAVMIAFGAKHSPAALYFTGMATLGLLIQGGFGGLYAVAARIYPTEVKTTGVGWAIGVGRLGAVAGPAVGGLTLSAGVDVFGNFILFSVPLVIAAVLTLVVARLRPETHLKISSVSTPSQTVRG